MANKENDKNVVAKKCQRWKNFSMEIANIRMCPLQVVGNVTHVVVRSMSVVMHRLTCVHAAGIKGTSMNTVHNKYVFLLQNNYYLYHLCSHGRKVL